MEVDYNMPEDIDEYLRWREEQDFWKEHKKRLENRVINHYNKKIENIAKGLIPKVNDFVTSSITTGALKKGNIISRRISQLARKPFEIYMYLTNPLERYNNDDMVIRDVYIARDQEVTTSTCDITVLGKMQSMADINDNIESKIMGWSHSHGALSLFHSSRDNEHIQDFVLANGIKKRVEIMDSPNLSLKMDFEYSPSVVFNAKNYDPYCAVAVRYPQFTDDGIQYLTTINQNADINVINEESAVIDNDLIDAQILDYVSNGGKKLIEDYSCGNLKIKQDILAPLSALPKIVYKTSDYVKNRIFEKLCQKKNI